MILWIGLALFAATNIDDILVLLTFFADPSFRARQVVVGQYAGILALIGVSLLGAAGLRVVPLNYVSLLGVVPILLGLWKLVSLRRPVETPVEEPHVPPRFAGSRFLAVAAVTVANGGDNVGAYVPLFSTRGALDVAILVATFLVLTGVWCIAAHRLVHHPRVGLPDPPAWSRGPAVRADRSRRLHPLRVRRRLSGGAKRAPVRLWAGPHDAPEVAAQDRGRGESDLGRDPLDRQRCRLEQGLGPADPGQGDPRGRSCADLLLKATAQRARAHGGAPGDDAEREALAEVPLEPFEQAPDRCTLGRGGQAGDELCLTTGSFERHHRRPGHLGRGRGAKIEPHQMEAEVEAGGSPGRREDVPVVDVEDIRIDVDVRVAAGQLGGGRPVSRGPQPVERAGGREDERAAADRGDPRTPLDRPADLAQDGRGDRSIEAVDSRDDHRVGAPQRGEAPRHADPQVFALDLRIDAADSHLIRRSPAVPPDPAEELARRGEVAEHDAVEGDHGHEAPWRESYGHCLSCHWPSLPGFVGLNQDE